MVGHVVLDGGTVANGVDVAEWCAVESEMGVRLESVFVGLHLQGIADALAELGLGWIGSIRWEYIYDWRGWIDVQTPVDQRQNPMGSSLVTVSPFSFFCVNRILSFCTSTTLELVRISTWSRANRAYTYALVSGWVRTKCI